MPEQISENDVILEKEARSETEPDIGMSSLRKSFSLIEEQLGVVISTRGNRVFIKGPEDAARLAERILDDIQAIRNDGYPLRPEDIQFAIDSISRGEDTSLKELFSNHISVPAKRKFIIPKTETQRRYIKAIRK